MAITKLGPLLSGIRGTVGGVVFSENKAGTFAKLWAPPSQPRTSRQSIERAYLAQMPNLWRDLTGVQQAAWDTFAALAAQELTNSLGDAYYISGYGWFCKCNVRLLRVGLTPLVPVPTQARPAAPTIDDFRVCTAGAVEPDLCCCGVATASTDQGAPNLPSAAFDDNLVTHWRTLAPNTTGWLKYVFPGAENVKHYALWSDDPPSTQLGIDWTFQVWTSGAWVTLHTVSTMSYVGAAWNHFYFPNPYTETDYRINITLNNGHPTNLIVFELEMFTADENKSVICFPEDDFDSAPDWDLILHISLGGSIGRQVQYPGFYEIIASQTPGRWFQLFQDELETVFGTIQEQRSWFCQLYR
ncbi:hypothetical protein LCGC14_2346350, partial [marine sediment metagenome]